MTSTQTQNIPETHPARLPTSVLPLPDTVPSFIISANNRSYKHQYANIYFVRLRILRRFVEERAERRWKNVTGNPVLVPRVLEVVKSQLCYVVGTVYMDMPLKPNVMEDIARDKSIPPPPPPSKFCSPDDNVMLEDESGRLRIVGERVKAAQLVTGVIIGALGMETPNGDFEVVDICYPGMAPQTPDEESEGDKMVVDGTGRYLERGSGHSRKADIISGPSSAVSNSLKSQPSDEWIALVSGLDIGAVSPADAQIQMLVEYLTGEQGGDNNEVPSISQISRLIIAGNSLAAVATTSANPVANPEDRKPRRYGYDSTSFSVVPVQVFSAHLLTLCQAMPVHILPGDTDPAGTILPQQPFPRAMFGASSAFASFNCETNPTYIRIASGLNSESNRGTKGSASLGPARTFLVNSGQPLNDMFKYLFSPPATRIGLLESTLRWRHMAPTAPDTLWCHPYFSTDPFIIAETPDVYVVGGQKRFGTKLVEEARGEQDDRVKSCRVVMVPSFAATGLLVLLNLRTLDVKTIKFVVEGMTAGGDGEAAEEEMIA